MPRATLYVVLLISCAHALVHAYEQSLSSVEQQIAAEFFPSTDGEPTAEGKRFTGGLSHSWRLMWGLGAIIAGLLVDRFGSRPLVAVYLLGCAGACAMAAWSTDRPELWTAMLLMGGFASIYHPAGLALISHETSAEQRARALGVHGIFGSAGIGLTPFVIGLLLATGYTWRHSYWVLMAPGLAVGSVFVWQAVRHRPQDDEEGESPPPPTDDQDHVDWRSYFSLTLMAAVQGFIYSALLTFLPRYLSVLQLPGLSDGGDGNFLTAGVLLLGCIGQDLSGRFARLRLLERQMTVVTLLNVPFLAWMAFATGWDRAVAAGLLALVHFMHQPLYNSLIAKYTPRRQRSLCYGFSFAMGLGIGSFGALFAGSYTSDLIVYGTLALAAIGGAVICLLLCWLNRIPLDVAK